MKQFSHIWLITEPIKCGITGCFQHASWLITYDERTRLLCDDHKAIELVFEINANREWSDLPPCRIDISYGNEESEPKS